MSNFIKIVKNYECICRLGHQIINHKDLVRRACPSKLDEEFRKQKEKERMEKEERERKDKEENERREKRGEKKSYI